MPAVTCVALHGSVEDMLTSSCFILSFGTANDKSGRVFQISLGSAKSAVTQYRKHNARVVCGRFRPDGALVATGGGDRAVHVWSSTDGEVGLGLT